MTPNPSNGFAKNGFTFVAARKTSPLSLKARRPIAAIEPAMTFQRLVLREGWADESPSGEAAGSELATEGTLDMDGFVAIYNAGQRAKFQKSEGLGARD